MPKTAVPSPTILSVDAKGYKYVENAPWWKEACEKLPCFNALQWPDYDTKVIEDTIDGQPVVIQLWKGWCQKFLGLKDYPGGIGAEVGIYRRPTGLEKLVIPPAFPKPVRFLMKAAISAAGKDLWWPYPALQTTLTFDFVNPKTGEKIFSAGPDKSYWLCKWMYEDSYSRYKYALHGKSASRSELNRLDFTINGKSYSW
jgi:hypothetical protein